jgi:hypothetical protein
MAEHGPMTGSLQWAIRKADSRIWIRPGNGKHRPDYGGNGN